MAMTEEWISEDAMNIIVEYKPIGFCCWPYRDGSSWALDEESSLLDACEELTKSE